MADRSTVEFVGGSTLTVTAPPHIVQENIARAQREGGMCQLLVRRQ